MGPPKRSRGKDYQVDWLVVVLPDEGQTLGNELRFHFLTTYDDLHPRFQVEDTGVRLPAGRTPASTQLLTKVESDQEAV